MPNIITSFYKYARVDDPVKFQQELLDLSRSLDLKGRIMVGEEGLNGCAYGTKHNIEKFKKELSKNKLFNDIDFKDLKSDYGYRKLFVRLRKEIVNANFEVDIENISPKELKESLDKKEDIVLVDMRNDYEFKIGKFKDARLIRMRNFRELPSKLEEIEDLRDKKVVTYCTGGVRCEKASAFLKENGFQDVKQLRGGILRYEEEYPDTYFEGKCYVFDDRIGVQLNKKNVGPISNCEWCDKPCDDYLNCHNIDCDKRFIACDGCRELHNKSCCEECSAAKKRRKELVLAEHLTLRLIH
jgi:UPF0176 protein